MGGSAGGGWGGFPSAAGHNTARREGGRKSACGTWALSSKEDLECGGPTWTSLVVLGQKLLVHFPLLLLFLDLGLLVDLLDGLGSLVCPPGHPVVLEGREMKRMRGVLAWQR